MPSLALWAFNWHTSDWTGIATNTCQHPPHIICTTTDPDHVTCTLIIPTHVSCSLTEPVHLP